MILTNSNGLLSRYVVRSLNFLSFSWNDNVYHFRGNDRDQQRTVKYESILLVRGFEPTNLRLKHYHVDRWSVAGKEQPYFYGPRDPSSSRCQIVGYLWTCSPMGVILQRWYISSIWSTKDLKNVSPAKGVCTQEFLKCVHWRLHQHRPKWFRLGWTVTQCHSSHPKGTSWKVLTHFEQLLCPGLDFALNNKQSGGRIHIPDPDGLNEMMSTETLNVTEKWDIDSLWVGSEWIT